VHKRNNLTRLQLSNELLHFIIWRMFGVVEFMYICWGYPSNGNCNKDNKRLDKGCVKYRVSWLPTESAFIAEKRLHTTPWPILHGPFCFSLYEMLIISTYNESKYKPHIHVQVSFFGLNIPVPIHWFLCISYKYLILSEKGMNLFPIHIQEMWHKNAYQTTDQVNPTRALALTL